MSHMPGPMPELDDSAAPPALWREIVDGTAGPVVRVAVSVALAPLLAGVACFGSYIVAGLVPAWSRRWSTDFGPSDELIASMLGLAGVAYLAAVWWIWSRRRDRTHELWRAGLATLGVVVATIVFSMIVAEIRILRGSQEVLIGGLVCLGGAWVILIWVQAARKFIRGRPSHNPADGALDLRCPSCGYRMVGLRESRCPECGSEYTLDELLGRQGFLLRGRPASGQAPPMPPSGSAGQPTHPTQSEVALSAVAARGNGEG